ncbi:hypothetical protein C8R47DRAFT_1165054 [Mycena vitilis]|nr:hypothetical protein C8R47DRAFT_1165054 [Mycena vitilis]
MSLSAKIEGFLSRKKIWLRLAQIWLGLGLDLAIGKNQTTRQWIEWATSQITVNTAISGTRRYMPQTRPSSENLNSQTVDRPLRASLWMELPST